MDHASLIPCTQTDLPALQELSVRTFTEAFAHQNNPEDFQAFLSSAFHPDKLAREWEDPESRFFFIGWKGEKAGYLKVNAGKAQSELQDPEAFELERIYVLAEFQGKGLGTWALLRVMELARQANKAYVWLGVWEKNHGALAFYRRHGFTIFDKHAFYVGTDKQTDYMMRRDL